jgi:hypothetical protein
VALTTGSCYNPDPSPSDEIRRLPVKNPAGIRKISRGSLTTGLLYDPSPSDKIRRLPVKDPAGIRKISRGSLTTG